MALARRIASWLICCSLLGSLSSNANEPIPYKQMERLFSKGAPMLISQLPRSFSDAENLHCSKQIHQDTQAVLELDQIPYQVSMPKAEVEKVAFVKTDQTGENLNFVLIGSHSSGSEGGVG